MRLVEILFHNPFVTVGRVEQELGLTNQGARNLIRQAEANDWLRVLGTRGRGGREMWVASEILEVISRAHTPR